MITKKSPASFFRHFVSFLIIVFVAAVSGFTGSYLQQQYFSAGLDNEAGDKPGVETGVETVHEVLPENKVIEVAEKMEESVVSVVATKELEYVMRDPFNFFFGTPFENDPFFNDSFGIPPSQKQSEPEIKKETKQVGAGTGFVISTDGLILTNKHVVSDPEAEYTVIFADDSELQAEVVTRDPADDIAIIRIKDSQKRKEQIFTPVSFIANIDSIRVGQMVIAFGNALGQFKNTVTTGVVSAKGREIMASGLIGGRVESLNHLLQTDAAINPGNSGGPLCSLTGEVLGVNTAVAGGAQGIGFAIPVDQKKIDTILDQIEKYGKIVRPFLGVRYQIVTPEVNEKVKLGTNHGSWLRGDNDLPAVIADTPASKAGLKGGDIIIKVGEQEIDEDNDLSEIISQYSPDDEVEMTILRDGHKEKIMVTLGERGK